MHSGVPSQISLLKFDRVVWPQLSQQWLTLVCTSVQRFVHENLKKIILG